MEISYVIFCLLSLFCLFSFLVYIRHFFAGHWSIYELNKTGSFSLPRRILLWFASIGLVVCIWSGIDLMLFWFPEDSGFINGEGEFTTYKMAIILPIIVFSLLGTYVALITMAEDQKKGIYYEILANGYDKILKANRNKVSLISIKKEFEEAANVQRRDIKNEEDRYCKKGLKLGAYEDLISYIQDSIAETSGEGQSQAIPEQTKTRKELLAESEMLKEMASDAQSAGDFVTAEDYKEFAAYKIAQANAIGET